MSGVRAFARQPDGTETDITEGVQALYDLVVSSMDFRSGFWTAEDARPVALLARVLGFGNRDEIGRYLRKQEHGEQRNRFVNEHRGPAAMTTRTGEPLPHDHVFSTAGRCMWPRCEALGEMDPPGEGE